MQTNPQPAPRPILAGITRILVERGRSLREKKTAETSKPAKQNESAA